MPYAERRSANFAATSIAATRLVGSGDDTLHFKRFGGMSVQFLPAIHGNMISKSAPAHRRRRAGRLPGIARRSDGTACRVAADLRH